jgi:hypothetical protein
MQRRDFLSAVAVVLASSSPSLADRSETVSLDGKPVFGALVERFADGIVWITAFRDNGSINPFPQEAKWLRDGVALTIGEQRQSGRLYSVTVSGGLGKPYIATLRWHPDGSATPAEYAPDDFIGNRTGRAIVQERDRLIASARDELTSGRNVVITMIESAPRELAFPLWAAS